MRYAVLGTGEATVETARAVLDAGSTVAAMVTLPEHLLPNNSADIQAAAKELGVPSRAVQDINDPKSVEILRELDVDYFLSQWPRILDREVLEVPRKFPIQTHPTDLPHNRGRHPLHWLIALGFEETVLTFFKMEEGIDTGPVLLKIPFSLGEGPTIAEAVHNLNEATYEGTVQLCRKLAEDPERTGAEQDESKANVWRKRTPHDVTLDPRMSVDSVVRTVRSFSQPYPCANLILGDHILKVVDAQPVPPEALSEAAPRLEHGAILVAEGRNLRVKLADGVVQLELAQSLPTELSDAGYLHPPGRYLAEHGPDLAKRLSEVT